MCEKEDGDGKWKSEQRKLIKSVTNLRYRKEQAQSYGWSEYDIECV